MVGALQFLNGPHYLLAVHQVTLETVFRVALREVEGHGGVHALQSPPVYNLEA